ncbi:MAG: YlbF family regulator [Anaerovoracaceae bacterium]|jgi:cell fate (sporulation/competence/biofilm development) regulator YlbF (YheA/YmcA/DUF963 family)
MNVHDHAHNLARALKESPEYKNYMEMKAKASENSELASMLNDFQAKQFEIQKSQMFGEELGPEMMEQVQSLYQILMKDPVAAQYLQAEISFSLLVNDIYSILGEAIKTDNE